LQDDTAVDDESGHRQHPTAATAAGFAPPERYDCYMVLHTKGAAAFVIAVAFALSVTACRGVSLDGGDSKVETKGVIVTVGGPWPGGPKPISGAEFRLVGSGDQVAIHADRNGRFTVDLAPGAYRVVITGHAPQSNGEWMPTIPDRIVVARGSTRPVRLVVSIK
jgi:hypothetical protein